MRSGSSAPDREFSDSDAAFERAPSPLEALRFRLEEPAPRAAILRSLGSPAPWLRPEPIEIWLNPTYRAAAKLALDIALGTPPAGPSLSDDRNDCEAP